ncbi:MAG: hypothetical protein ACTS5R_00555 [Candidatus Hodgkinia cicadicola]
MVSMNVLLVLIWFVLSLLTMRGHFAERQFQWKRNHTSNGFEVEWIDWFAGRMDVWTESAHSGRKDDLQIV